MDIRHLKSHWRDRIASHGLCRGGEKHCPKCNRLGREYQLTIGQIYSVVEGGFKTVGEKLHELFRWQEMRDEAVKTFYEHNADSCERSFWFAQDCLARPRVNKSQMAINRLIDLGCDLLLLPTPALGYNPATRSVE